MPAYSASHSQLIRCGALGITGAVYMPASACATTTSALGSTGEA